MDSCKGLDILLLTVVASQKERSPRQIIIPKTEKHDGLFVTDSFIVFIILTLIKRFSDRKRAREQGVRRY